MKYLLAIALLFNFLICHAAIYHQVDENGQTIYSDLPLGQTAKVIDLNATNTSPQIADTTEKKSAIISPVNEPHVYSNFMISDPTNEQTFQNQRTIPVEVKMDPKLLPGDKIQLYLDGKPVGPAFDSIHLQLTELERGTHQLSAAIIDQNQQIIKQSQTITIYVHLASIGLKKPS